MKEIWKDIPGYERLYQASNKGRIKSIERKISGRVFKGHILVQSMGARRYLQVSLCRDSKRHSFFIHKLIAKTFLNPQQIDYEVDHKDRNVENNYLNNLRLSNKSNNAANRGKRKGTSSIYKGVSKNRNRNKWQSAIKHNYISYFLGYFYSEGEAAKAYDRKAIELFGEHARTNEMMGLFTHELQEAE